MVAFKSFIIWGATFGSQIGRTTFPTQLRVRSKVKPLVERDAEMALALGHVPGSRPGIVDGEDDRDGDDGRVPFGMP